MKISDKSQIKQTLFLLILYSIAMGFMETAVVVYLRNIYYPEGFQFPLIPVSTIDGITELLRELATIIMLIAVAFICSKNAIHRFAFFLLSFAIWDLCYYIFLKMLLNWPESIFTWDILFLIPIPWLGPVIAPVLLSILMLVFSFVLLKFKPETGQILITFPSLIKLVTGSLVTIFSFIINYLIFKNVSPLNLTSNTMNSGINELNNYKPDEFYWWIYFSGVAILVWEIISIHSRITKINLKYEEPNSL